MQVKIIVPTFVLGALLMACSIANASTPNETVAEALQKIENMPVSETTRPLKDYSLRAFKNAVNAYCHAEKLTSSECADKQASEMRKWHRDKADRVMKNRSNKH